MHIVMSKTMMLYMYIWFYLALLYSPGLNSGFVQIYTSILVILVQNG
jgi:hypothetical protein